MGLSLNPTVPSLNARAGFQDLAPVNGVCGQGARYPGFDPLILPYIDTFYPAPNGACNGGGSAQGFYNPKEQRREDFAIARFDENFSNKDSLSLSYLFDDGHSLVPQLDPIFAVDTRMRAQVFSAQETHIITPSLINVATFGYSLNFWHFTTPSTIPIPASLELVSGRFIGRFAIGGTGGASSGTISSGGGGKGIDSKTHTSRTTYADTISLSKGRHQFMAGLWFMPIYSNETTPVTSGGFPTFTSVATLETNTVSNFQVAPSATAMHWSTFEGAWFVQDIIQVKPNLTLRLGLRHEFTDGYSEVDGKATVYPFVNGIPQTAFINTDNTMSPNNMKWMFGPRIGIAYDPHGNGKTSIRAGFGIHFDLQDSLGTAFNSSAPYNGVIVFRTSKFTSLVPFQPTAINPPSCSPTVSTNCGIYAVAGIPSNSKAPTVDEWNLSIERAIGPNMSLTVGYVGSHFVHGPMLIPPDAIPPLVCAVAAGCLAGGTSKTNQSTVPLGTLYIPAGGPGVANTLPNPFVGNGGTYLAFENNSSYNALEVGFKRRFSAGLQFQVNYTWSKAEDFMSGWSADDANDNPSALIASNPGADWGPSSSDKRNKLSANAAYELPFGNGKHWMGNANGAVNKLVSGWQLNAILTATSGFPFENNIGNNFSGDGNSFAPDRPYWNPNFKGNPITGNPNQWFNPDAFTLCAPYQAANSACMLAQTQNDLFYQGAPKCSTPGVAPPCAPDSPVALPGAAFGTYGNVGRNVLTGPNLINLDMSLFKKTSITERVTAEFRVEGFNMLNRANYATPGLSGFSGTMPSPSAGQISATATTSRQLQFGLKVLF